MCCWCPCRICICLLVVYKEQLIKFIKERTGADSKRERERERERESDECSKIEVTAKKKKKE
jgi:hypothetical protein